MQLFFVYFLIYSFLGFLIETSYVFLMDGKLVERGFLFGPVIPIYGFGAMAIISALNSYKNNIFLIFILGVLLTSTLEYVTSYVMEKMFDMRWWDYTKQKFNIKGRICLRNSLMFGFLSVLLIQFIHPFISDFVQNFNAEALDIFARLTFLIIMLDWTLSMKEVINFRKYMVDIENLRLNVRTVLEEQNISISFKEFIEQGEEFFDTLDSKLKDLHIKIKNRNNSFKKRQKRLLGRFPELSSKRFDKIIESIKEYNKK